MGALLASLGLTRIDVLPYHRAGLAKYDRLQRPYRLPDTQPPTAERQAHVVRLLESCGLIVQRRRSVMTERVARLRQESLDRKPTLSTERAELMTAFYREAPAAPLPILRALLAPVPDGAEGALHPARRAHRRRARAGAEGHAHLPGAVLPHARGPRHPGLAREDLVRASTIARGPHTATTIIPFWRGRSMRDRMFAELPDEWKARLRGRRLHRVHGAARAGPHRRRREDLRQGLAGLQADIDRELAALDDLRDLDAYDKRQQLKGMRIAADAVIRFAGATPTRRRAWPPPRPTRSARRSSSRSPPTARGCPSTRRARSGRRCRRTGSCTSASSPS